MSELGVFAVDRGIFEHHVFNDGQPFSRREAWLWLLAEAAWKGRIKAVPGSGIRLSRGQLSHSIRFMASAWNWDKARVERFLGRLKTETMIETHIETGQTVITICKYDDYQRVSLPAKTPSETAGETATRQGRDKLGDIQAIQEGILSEPAVHDTSKPTRTRKVYPEDFEAAWLAYPNRTGMSKAEALPPWTKLSIEDRAKVLPSIAGYIGHLKTKPDLETIHFCRYLSKRRFEAFPAQVLIEDEPTWRRRLIYARDQQIWSTAKLGPMPGRPGCRVPPELLLPGDGDGWQEARAA